MANYTDAVGTEEEDIPAFVQEGTDADTDVIEGEDVSQASAPGGNENLDPKNFPGRLKGIVMSIKKAVIDTYVPNDAADADDFFSKSLNLTLVVGPEGLDGAGKYKNKHFFPRVLVGINRKSPTYEYGESYAAKTGNKWGEYNELLTALGFSNNPAPRNDENFRKALIGRQISYDITLEDVKKFNRESKKYEKTGDQANKLRNAKAVKAKAAEVAEAATE